MTEPRYSASTAANVVLAIAVVTAALLAFSGYVSIRAGSGLGWVLLGLALLALIMAIGIRFRLGSSADGERDPTRKDA